jgi:hypothetical protein
MAMPAEMAAQGPNPEEMAIYEQMRQQISPQEFSNEMLAGASQVDPQAVAEFTEELRSLDVSPEELDALNDLVDQILANPEQYDQLRQQFLAQGMPDDILPEQFDPYFFAALNMAVDQMIAAPTGVQAFAKGGIAELKPIAKAIASYGRNGDTMLAHITPAEARMLKRRGGSGTINPATGLPEFFLKKAFKKIGKAVKKFASSTVGRLVTTVALGFFLGPAAASFLGASSVAGVAAVSGFVGSAGSTLLAGGNLKDALKAGAVGGITAGAGAGLMGGADAFASGSASTAGLTPGQAFQGQIDKFTGAFTPGAAAQAPVPEAGAPTAGLGPNQMPVPAADPLGDFIQQNEALRTAANTPARMPGAGAPASTGAYKPPTVGESFSKIGEGLGMGDTPASFETFKQGATDLFSPGPTTEQLKLTPEYADAMSKGKTMTESLAQAAKANAPGMLRTYGPAAVAGTGIMALSGGFDTKPVEGGDITKSLMKTADERIREKGTQRQMYMQGLPGVVYDEFGAPVFGQSTRLPTYDVPDYDYGGFNMSGAAAGGQGGMSLPPVYNTPSGSIGSRQVAQPYNTSSMYTNLMGPQRYADGGQVNLAGHPLQGLTPEQIANIPGMGSQGIGIAGDSLAPLGPAIGGSLAPLGPAIGGSLAPTGQAMSGSATQQQAGRDIANQRRAMRRAGGSGQMYANINAGLAALAPENFPGAPVQLAADREAAMRTNFTGLTSDIDYARVMQDQGYRPEEVAALTGRSFGDINRRFRTAVRQDAAAPMLQGQRFAMDQQAGIAASGQLPRDISMYSGQDKAELYRGMARQGLTDAQIRAAAENRYGMQSDTDWRGLQGTVADPTLNTQRPVQPPGAPPNDEVFHFGIDEYGRGARDGFGTAPPPGMPPIYQPAVTQPPVTQPPVTQAPVTDTQITDFLASDPNLTDRQIRDAMDQFGVGVDQMANVTGIPAEQIQQRYNAAAPVQPPSSLTDQDILGFLSANPGMTDIQIRGAMDQYGVDPARMASATGMPLEQIQQRYNAAAAPTAFMNMGGIAGLAQGGYPRRTGQISGPGTEKSDSIPAMLSDGEFVMTAKAVRGAGKGSRRAGAKQMYKLMHQLEKNSERG